MPVYGDEKRRSMARSVLPAKRSAARQARERRAGTHRAVRAEEHRTLRRLVVTMAGGRSDSAAVAELAVAYDDADVVAPGSRHGGPFGGIADMVGRRRGGDAVGPLLRWATHHAPALGDHPAARVVAIARLLPDNLAGHHALTHVRWLREYDDRPTSERRWPRDDRTHRERHAEALCARREAIDDLRHRLTAAIHGHGLLNAALKRQRCAVCSARGPRLLHGLHDVDAFATHVVDWGSPCEQRLVGQVLRYVTRT